MILRIKGWRRVFFNLIILFTLLAGLILIFRTQTYHSLLYLIYENTVDRVQPDGVDLSRLLVLDTREKAEFDVSHLKNARWIGYSDFNMQRVESFPKDTPIVVYCSVGYRSEKIGEQMQAAGFTDVKNLYGGIFEWKNNGFPVYRNAVESDSVHTFGPGWGFFLRNGKGVVN